jgi:DNA-binding LacI/PurR family transcriptional regulator
LAVASISLPWFCYDDIAAIGAIRVIREHGLRVSRGHLGDGFDDIESASYNTPSLTTIRLPLQRMGTIAAHTLLKRIRGLETFRRVTPILPELGYSGVDLSAQHWAHSLEAKSTVRSDDDD